jgi:hypothetical protein
MGMSNRMAIQWAIAEYVSDAVAKGIELDATTAALQLSTKYPQSGYTLDDIIRMIEELGPGGSTSAAGISRLQQEPSSQPKS